MDSKKLPIEEAIDAAGSQAALVAAVDRPRFTQQNISYWLNRCGGSIPEEFCPYVEKATGVKCERLRPDVEWQRDKRGQITGYLVRVKREAA